MSDFVLPFGSLGNGKLADWTFGDAPAERAMRQSDQAASDGLSIASTVALPRPQSRVNWSTPDGLATFEVDLEARKIVPSHYSSLIGPSGLTHLLFDQVAPRILDQLGYFVIHASAVEIDGRLALFIGESGAGKSTLAASFHASGFAMPGDDAIVIMREESRFVGESLYRSLRLDPATAQQLLGSTIKTEPMAEYSPKHKVALCEEQASERLPLGGLFFLHCPEIAHAPKAEKRSPAQTCVSLLEHSFALDPNDPEQAQKRFRAASGVANQVPAFDLSYPDGLELLATVRQVVLNAIHAEQEQRAE